MLTCAQVRAAGVLESLDVRDCDSVLRRDRDSQGLQRDGCHIRQRLQQRLLRAPVQRGHRMGHPCAKPGAPRAPLC
jgi:hypothetical protein